MLTNVWKAQHENPTLYLSHALTHWEIEESFLCMCEQLVFPPCFSIF